MYCRGSSVVERRPEKAAVASSILAPGTRFVFSPPRLSLALPCTSVAFVFAASRDFLGLRTTEKAVALLRVKREMMLWKKCHSQVVAKCKIAWILEGGESACL